VPATGHSNHRRDVERAPTPQQCAGSSRPVRLLRSRVRHHTDGGSEAATLVDVSAVDGLFDLEQIDRARAYHRPLYRAALVGTGLDLVVLALLSFSVVGDGMYALTDGWAWWVRGIAFSVLVLVLTSAVHLPVGFWAGYLHEHHWELSTQSLGGWWRDRLKGLAVTVALTTSLLVGLLAVARVFPAAWPVIVAGASALVVFGLSFVSPVVLEPLFNRFRPLPDRELAMTCETSPRGRTSRCSRYSSPTRAGGRGS